VSIRLDIPRPRRIALAVAAVLLSAIVHSAPGQGRRSVYVHSPSSPTTTGEILLNRLRHAPAQSVYGGSAGPLLPERNPVNIRHSTPRPMPTAAGSFSLNRLAYRPLPADPTGLLTRSSSPVDGPALPAAPFAFASFDTVRQASDSCLFVGREVNTLVPCDNGESVRHMGRGEAALRTGNCLQAWGHFRLAAICQPDLPEAPLGMALARLSTTIRSWSSVAVHMQQTVRLMPSLPLVRLRLADLLGGPDSYTQIVRKLERHMEAEADDAEAVLVLSLLRAFEGDRDQAAGLLARADRVRRATVPPDHLDTDPLLATVQTLRRTLNAAVEYPPPPQAARTSPPTDKAGQVSRVREEPERCSVPVTARDRQVPYP